jgi:hypothetical protein
MLSSSKESFSSTPSLADAKENFEEGYELK